MALKAYILDTIVLPKYKHMHNRLYKIHKIRIFLIYTLTNMFTLIVLFRNSNSVAVLIMKKGDV